MSNQPSPADERTLYGGQAVVEGVMMRSPRYFAIACRRLSSQEIVVKLEPVEKTLRNLQWLNKPFLRGTLALIDAMLMGYRALVYSANIQLEDEAASDDSVKSEALAAEAAALTMGEGGPVAGIPRVRENQSISNIAIGASTILAILFGTVLFWTIPGAITDRFAVPHLHAIGTPLTAAARFGANVIEGGIRLLIFFAYISAISRMKNVQRVFQYHGAEHKAINTLEAGLPVTLENARAASRIHPRCGTNFIFIVLITAIVVFSVVPRHGFSDGFELAMGTHLLRLLLLPVVAGVSFEILKLAGKYRHQAWAKVMVAPGLATQYLTTRVPDDNQIEVAVASLLAVWDKEHETRPGAASEPAAGVA